MGEFSLAQAITRYRQEGLSFFPLPFKAKKDDNFKWGVYQERQPTEDEIKSWFNGHPTNIAVVCGKVSGNLVIVEFDNEDYYCQFEGNFFDKQNMSILDFTRVSKGKRGPHVWLRVKTPVRSKKFPKCEIRSDGNYIVVPPSVHPDGPVYQFLNEAGIREVESLTEVGIDVSQQSQDGQSSNQPGWVSQLLLGVGEGQRNDSAIRLAGYFRNTLPIDVTERIMLDWNNRNTPPLPVNEIQQAIKSSYGYPVRISNTYIKKGGYRGESLNAEAKALNSVNSVKKREETLKITSSDIKNYIMESGGQWIFTRDLDNDLGIFAPAQKTLRRQIIHQLLKDGLVEKDAILNTKFRFVNADTGKIQISVDTLKQYLPIILPFDIQDKVDLYPKNIAVVAGTLNSGKTAFLLNVARQNKGQFKIVYFSSEMVEQELTSRILCFGDSLKTWQEVDFRERSQNFADVIRGDWLNIIDYIELNENIYQIGAILEQIYNKLTTGLAIVAIQKKLGALLGRGQEFSAEKPRLYLSMDSGKLTIVKGKNWHVKGQNPNRQQIQFKLINGCEFIPIGDWEYIPD
jgi:hypothetical protein